MKRLQASNLGVRRRGLMMGVMGTEVRNGKSEGTLDHMKKIKEGLVWRGKIRWFLIFK